MQGEYQSEAVKHLTSFHGRRTKIKQIGSLLGRNFLKSIKVLYSVSSHTSLMSLATALCYFDTL